MKCGIYQICNKINGKIYIGSSKHIEKRWKRHRTDLRCKRHANIYLQNSYTKYNLDNFEFTILEECNESELLIKEQFWINKLKPEYNIGSVGGGDNISNHPNLKNIRKKHSLTQSKIRDSLTIEERKAKWGRPHDKNPNWKGGISKRYCPDCKKRMGTVSKKCISCCKKGKDNPFYGKTHSKETIEKIRKTHIGRHAPHAKKIFINGIEYRSQTEASKILGIHVTTISHRIRHNFPGYTTQPHQPSQELDNVDNSITEILDMSNQK